MNVDHGHNFVGAIINKQKAYTIGSVMNYL